MIYEQYETVGEDNEDLSFGHALKEGGHDAISDMLKFTLIGGAVLALYYIIGEKKISGVLKKVRK